LSSWTARSLAFTTMQCPFSFCASFPPILRFERFFFFFFSSSSSSSSLFQVRSAATESQQRIEEMELEVASDRRLFGIVRDTVPKNQEESRARELYLVDFELKGFGLLLLMEFVPSHMTIASVYSCFFGCVKITCSRVAVLWTSTNSASLKS
jgi:hypothetical protein